MQKQVSDPLLVVLHPLQSGGARRQAVSARTELRVTPLNSVLDCYYVSFQEKEQQLNISSAACEGRGALGSAAQLPKIPKVKTKLCFSPWNYAPPVHRKHNFRYFVIRILCHFFFPHFCLDMKRCQQKLLIFFNPFPVWFLQQVTFKAMNSSFMFCFMFNPILKLTCASLFSPQKSPKLTRNYTSRCNKADLGSVCSST